MAGSRVSSAGLRRSLAVVAGLLALATGVAMWALWPSDQGANRLGLTGAVYEAKVLTVDRRPCGGTEASGIVDCDAVVVRLTEGPDTGETRDLEFPLAPGAPKLGVGDTVVLTRDAGAADGFEYQYSDRQRRLPLAILAVAFASLLVLLGWVRGLAVLVGLGLSILALVQFVIPAVLDGRSPVLVAIVGAAAIAYVALYLAHGFTTVTNVALLGTLAALGGVLALATGFIALAHLAGFSSEEAALGALGSTSIDLSGLLLGGIVIGATGAVVDVAVRQVTSVWNLRASDASMPRTRMFAVAMRAGREHLASTTNTLVLAYVGVSLPLLVLFAASQQSIGTAANSEVVAVEIVRALVGALGLVAAVPLATWLATVVVRAPRPVIVPSLSDDGDDLSPYEDGELPPADEALVADADGEPVVSLAVAETGRRRRGLRGRHPPPSEEEQFWSGRRRSP